jgi:hypothetical protein
MYYWRDLNISHTLGCVGRKNSRPSIGSHGHDGDTTSDQTLKTQKDLSTHESDSVRTVRVTSLKVRSVGGGESVGLYVVYIRQRGGLGR